MGNLVKSFSRDVAVLIAGAIVWLIFVALVRNAVVGVPPAIWVIIMGLYMIGYSLFAFWVHFRPLTPAVPSPGHPHHSRPTMMIPVMACIALIIFVVAYSGVIPVT